MFRGFEELSRKKLQKVAHFVKKDKKGKLFGQNLRLFERTIMFRRFDELFGKKL